MACGNHVGNGSSRSTLLRVPSPTWLIQNFRAQIAIVPPDVPDTYGGFELDSQRHLGLPPAPVSKMDGDFADLIVHQIRDIYHLNEKYVAIRADAIQWHLLQHLAAPHPIAGGHIPYGETQDRPGVKIAKGREQFTPGGPALIERAAFYIT